MYFSSLTCLLQFLECILWLVNNPGYIFFIINIFFFLKLADRHLD